MWGYTLVAITAAYLYHLCPKVCVLDTLNRDAAPTDAAVYTKCISTRSVTLQ